MITPVVFNAINDERQHQINKFGADKQQSLAGFLLIIESELEEAKRGWIKDNQGRNSPLHEIVQIAATCVACLEKYGVIGNTLSTDDRPIAADPEYLLGRKNG